MDGFIGVDDEERSDEAADGEGKRLLLLAPLPPAKGGAFPVAVRLMLAKGDEDLGVEEVRERRAVMILRFDRTSADAMPLLALGSSSRSGDSSRSRSSRVNCVAARRLAIAW